MIAVIVLLPLLLGMLAVALIRSMSKIRYAAIIAGAASLALLPLVNYGTTTLPWLLIAGSDIGVTISLTPLSLMLLSIVLLIGLFVLIYSAGYMESVLDHRRFYLEMLAFEAAMATFAVSGNFITLFIAWEFLSLTSYLLIGFLHNRNSAIRAARKALTIVFIGDLTLIGSIVLFWHVFGTLEFAQIISMAGAVHSIDLYIAVLLLLIAIFTKSAQFPFHEWLIDAMEGPTPVSAYLHSSTMVKAGVFAAILLYPLFAAPDVSWIIFTASAVTLVLSTLAAAREMHVKKVIAYSTIQELSIMMLAISSGAVLAAIYFFFVQSFYKALLFFGSGVAMEATGRENLDEVNGFGARKLAYLSTLFGVLSLAGFVPFSGFFSNTGISSSLTGNLPAYALLSGVAVLTSFYIVRWFSYLSRNDKRSASYAPNYLTMPRSMVYPMAVLAALTLAASAVFFSISTFLSAGSYLSYLPVQSPLSISATDGALFTVLIAVGAVLSYMVYYRRSIKSGIGSLNRIIYTGPIMNWSYHVVAVITSGLSAGISEFDSRLNDFFDSMGITTVRAGYGIRRVSVGSINTYAAIFILGILALFISFYYLVIV
jgi:NADH:ubiquinone oxidoreductase subunit 5 (subunit L)/multisubunit Na+/H+ antiporter MnhA subunit